MSKPTTRRIIPMSEWAPAQEALYASPTASKTGQNTVETRLDETPNSNTDGVKRLRSMSISFHHWRPRPKTGTLYQGDETDTSSFGAETLERAKNPMYWVGPNGYNAVVGSSKQELPSKLRSIIRRASVSLVSGVSGCMNTARRMSNAAPSASTESDSHRHSFRQKNDMSTSSSARPATSQSTWSRLRRATSLHRSSRNTQAADDEPMPSVLPIGTPNLPIPGSGEQPPIIPRNTGAAARQAAASAQYDSHGFGLSEISPEPRWHGSVDEDHESGIGIALSSEVESSMLSDDVDSDVEIDDEFSEIVSEISRIDFISRLPPELGIQIFALLDANALATASRVSKLWKRVIEDQQVWRESFLRERTGTYATGASVKPGAGLGVPAILPTNDWKEIYRAKDELDRRWREGKALPVYLNGHSDSVYCLQFDEDKIITGSRDRTIRIWDIHTFACRFVIGPPEVIKDASQSLLYDEGGVPVHFATLPETEQVVVAGRTGPPIRAHHSVPALISFPVHHKASILCLQYDDRILVTGSSDSTCIIHSLRSGYRPIRRLQHHTAAVLDLVFDEKHIVACSKDITICVWDREKGTLLKQLKGHTGPVNAVQMRGNTIVSCSGDVRVKLWNIDTGKNIREFSGHTKGLACSQFSEDGRYVASAGNDRCIRIWDANTGECVREMKAHDNLVRSLHVDSISGRLISGSYDTDIKVWDMETGQALLDFPHWHNSWVLSAKSDYRRIISTGQDPKILIMDFGAGVRNIGMLESGRGGLSEMDGGYI